MISSQKCIKILKKPNICQDSPNELQITTHVRGIHESTILIAAIQIISSNSCTAATPAGDFIVYLVGIVVLKEYFSQPRLTIAGYYGNAITGRPE